MDYDTGVVIETVPADLDQVSDYARDAVLKLWRVGLLAGDGTNFDPKGNATRAQTATLCMRTDKAVDVWYKAPGVPSDRVRKEPGAGDSQTGSSTTYYTFKFDTNGGSSISDRSIRAGAKLNSLPTPYKANAIFIGWYYDKALSQPVSADDTAKASTILYAKYEELPPLNEEFLSPVARSLDANKYFTITVKAPADMTLEAFMDAVTLKNLSSNENREWFKITGGSGTFTLSGVNYLGEKGAQQPGFVEGSAYKITLEHKDLFFEGQDPGTREYVFTIKREEVLNVSLNANLTQIPLSDISGLVVNGANASTISIPVITVGMDGAPAENGVTIGSFIYSKGTLAVGDTVMIYEGDTPPAMDSVSNSETVAYVEITAASGSHYQYKTAAAENVLFTPDILPVNVNADIDGNPSNNTMTVPISAMTYTDDQFALAGLDSQTTIDMGDFISFYSGTLKADGTLESGVLRGYAVITSVQTSGEYYIIAYRPVTLAEVQKSMAAYKKENIDSEELLEGVDKAAIERSVEKQARESGFAEEAGMYLAALALETDSFTQLSEDYQLTAVEMTMNGQPITQETLQSMGAAKAKVELSQLKATLSTNLVHFKGLKGLRLTLDVGVKVIVECNDDVTIEIEIVGSFEQEVRIDIGVDGDAIWEWWGIFPYIAEYEVSAYVELYEYTGIGVEATIVTVETDEDGFDTKNETAEKIGKQIKDLMDAKDKYLGDGGKTLSDSLEEKYSDMLENESAWVTLFEKALIDQDFHVLAVIAINIEIKFVVSANLNISLGMDFWYENAKRYVYTIQVFDKNVRSDVIDLVEEHWEFEFYVMGTMGLRAGIRAGISVGLFSTELASVGFSAEAGAYVRVWGYFYYQLKYTASQGRTSAYSGALLLEFGVYLEVNFEAQAIGGRFSYEKTLFEKEWPLLKAGDQDNVRDFAYSQKETPEIKLKSYITSARLPDSVFNMAYLDLKEGMEEDEQGNRVLAVANYDAPLEPDRSGLSADKLDDEKNFIIEINNPAFSYDPVTNTISVSPNGQVKQEGIMTITWKNRPMEFSSVPLRRTITLYWDNLKDGYIIAPFTNGGSYVPVILGKYEEDVKVPEDPGKLGYHFGGWFSDESLTKPYAFPKTMPNEDMSIYAKWIPATDTIYTVEHYQQRLGSSEYDLVERETFRGTTDSTVTPLNKFYSGFKSPEQEALVIKPDGSSVLRYYYERQTHTVTFNPGDVGGEPVVIRLKYGSTISAPQLAAKGYIFRGWDKTVATYMGDQDLTYTAQWEKEPTAEYRVEYYVQQPDGTYRLKEIVYGTGATGHMLDAHSLRKDDQYTRTGITRFRDVTVGGAEVENITITSDSKTVIKVNYQRELYTVTFKPENGSGDIVYTLYAGARIEPPKVSLPGFSLVAWEPEPPEILGTEPLEFTAQWAGTTGTTYKVKHVRQALDGSYPDDGALVEYEVIEGITGETTAGKAMSYVGFTAQPFEQAKIKFNGSTLVEIRYARSKYSVVWMVDGETYKEEAVYYGDIITKSVNPIKPGYELDYWMGYADKTVMGTANKTFVAQWKPASNTKYTVKHVFADEYGNYPTTGAGIIVETKYGTTNKQTSATAKKEAGFTAQGVTQPNIQADGSTEVTIYYNRNTYTVTWMFENKRHDSYDVTFGASIAEPESTPAKPGYRFIGWNKAYEKMPAQDLIIEAIFEPNSYNVEFEMVEEGVAPWGPITVTYGQPYGDQLDIKDEITTGDALQLTLKGWMDSSGRMVNKNTIVSVAAAHILTAVWVTTNEKPYRVEHLLQNVSDTEYTCVEVETRYGIVGAEATANANTYTGFSHVSTVTDIIADDGSAVVRVYYDRMESTITWHFNTDDSQGQPLVQTYRYQQPIAQPVVPARAGYKFMGWYDALNMTPPATMPAGLSLDYTAQWTFDSYTVSFDANGGSAHPESITVTYQGQYPVLEEISRTGYVFDGWYTAAVGGDLIAQGDVVEITHDITLYAHWTPMTYQVSFDLNGLDAVAPESITVCYGETFENLPGEPGTKTGYAFDGWYTAPIGGDKITPETTVNVTRDITLYARMVPHTYTVRFNGNGGSGTMVPQLFTYDQGQVLSINAFIRPGHTFIGWNTQPDGEGTAFQNTEYIRNLTAAQGEEINLYAQWEINVYTITFNSDGGTVVEAITEPYNTIIQKPEDPYKYGYYLAAWMSGANPISFPLELKENLNLTARWLPEEYAITYENMDGVENSNPAFYTIESNSIMLEDPGPKPGYTFMGWYTDASLSEESRVSGIAISWGSTGVRTFYASWKANTYGVNFDDGTQSNNVNGRMSSQTFVYDVEQPLKTNEFAIPGYNFIGWGLAPNSAVVYTDGEVVKNLTTSGSITLYAQWELIGYNISYTLGSGASGANNPTSYTIETAEIVLKEPSGIKEGYRFLGWYSGDTKVTSIPKGSMGNEELKAKWEHGGTFTLSVKSETANGNAKDVTFTVKRTIPSDATVTADIQYVYYRTVNGTAIGGTASPIHFSHVGGEDIFLTFGPNDTSKTFTVRNERAFTGNDDIVNSFTTGVNRYYDVELYKVVSVSNICTGALGATRKITRTITQGANYTVTRELQTQYYSYELSTENFKVTDAGFSKNKNFTITAGLFGLASGKKEALEQYNKAIGNKFGLWFAASVYEDDDGYQHAKLTSLSNSNNYIQWNFEIEKGKRTGNWFTLLLPKIVSDTDIAVTDYAVKGLSHLAYSGWYTVEVNVGERYKLEFDASGSGGDDWHIPYLAAYLAVIDSANPTVKRIAPMAYGKYKSGETVTIAVEFNEVIGTASGVTMGKISSIPVESWTYVDGAGTNVLLFRGKLTSDLTVTPDMNMTLTGTKPAVNGTIKDLAH